MRKGIMRKDFCVVCRKEQEYEMKIVEEKEVIKGKEYKFLFTTAVCSVCKEEMSVPGLIDLNIKERDEQYRKAEDIIFTEDIRKLMSIYNIGKIPLSFALGFGEVTISRYLEGQMPSKSYSNIMKRALESPDYMEKLLEENKEKVGKTAYEKALKRIRELKHSFCLSDKMVSSIAYIFKQMKEVTPLALQKLLYYVQGEYMAITKKPLFDEDCVAWQHGPVYVDVYHLFKDFKYNPIEDDRFVFFNGKEKKLLEEEQRVMDLVLRTFGKYSGKVLESITHEEEPWKDARKGYGVHEASNVIIDKNRIMAYFEALNEKYDINTVQGINKYIQEQIGEYN